MCVIQVIEAGHCGKEAVCSVVELKQYVWKLERSNGEGTELE